MIQNISPSFLGVLSPARKKSISQSNVEFVNFNVGTRVDTFTRFGSGKDYFRQKNIDTSLDSTKISHGDPKTGKLNYRGYDIKDLVANSNFNESAYLILYGKLPNVQELKAFDTELVRRRSLPEPIIEDLRLLAKQYPTAHPMDVLQVCIPLLGLVDSSSKTRLAAWDKAAHDEKSLDIIAKVPTMIAYIHRLQQGLDVCAPKPELSHSANFLYMLNGQVPDEKLARIFEKTLICYMDHGFNASTLATRSAASTGSSIFSAIGAGVNALSGKFHGGANEAVSQQLRNVFGFGQKEIGQYIQQQDQSGQKIFGFGHKKYKTADPRVEILAGLSDELADYYREQGMPETDSRLVWKKTGEEFKNYMQNSFRRKLPANVDYPIGYLYPMLGIPEELNTPVFALSRIVGWASHTGELQQDNTVYSPLGNYIGVQDLKYPVQHL